MLVCCFLFCKPKTERSTIIDKHWLDGMKVNNARRPASEGLNGQRNFAFLRFLTLCLRCLSFYHVHGMR